MGGHLTLRRFRMVTAMSSISAESPKRQDSDRPAGAPSELPRTRLPATPSCILRSLHIAGKTCEFGWSARFYHTSGISAASSPRPISGSLRFRYPCSALVPELIVYPLSLLIPFEFATRIERSLGQLLANAQVWIIEVGQTDDWTALLLNKKCAVEEIDRWICREEARTVLWDDWIVMETWATTNGRQRMKRIELRVRCRLHRNGSADVRQRVILPGATDLPVPSEIHAPSEVDVMFLNVLAFDEGE